MMTNWNFARASTKISYSNEPDQFFGRLNQELESENF